jgi:hypothetical protein
MCGTACDFHIDPEPEQPDPDQIHYKARYVPIPKPPEVPTGFHNGVWLGVCGHVWRTDVLETKPGTCPTCAAETGLRAMVESCGVRDRDDYCRACAFGVGYDTESQPAKRIGHHAPGCILAHLDPIWSPDRG